MSDEMNSPRILCQQCLRREGSGVYVSAHDLATLRTQLSAMTAERDEMRSDAAECDALREKLSAILTGTANALKGEPAPLNSHSWHDLPEFAAAVSKIGNEMIAKVVALEAERDAAVLDADISRKQIAARELERQTEFRTRLAAERERDAALTKVALLREALATIEAAKPADYVLQYCRDIARNALEATK